MDITASPSLPLTHCPSCDYDLNGLPTSGVCPECGKAYDDRFIVLYGMAVGKRAGIRNGSPAVVKRQLVRKFILWGAILFFGHWNPWVIVFFIMAMVPTVLLLAIRLFNARQSPVVVILCSQGVVQRDTADPRGVLHLLLRIWLAVTWIALGFYATAVATRNNRGVLVWLALLAAITLIRVAIRWKKAQKHLLITGPGGEPLRIVPWSDIQQAELWPVSEGRYRLKYSRPGPRAAVSPTVFVEAEVVLDSDRAEALQQITSQWSMTPPPAV